jgi:hypothetical protein
MKHLLDANTLIEAKNRYYSMTICPAYWDWLRIQHGAEQLASIIPIKDELTRGKDDLAEWAKENAGLFLSVDDEATQQAFGEVAQLAAQTPGMRPGALDEFLRVADPWLIAKAMTTGATLVTHEVLNLAAKRKFIIPNLCRDLDVRCINTFELLHDLDARFVLP